MKREHICLGVIAASVVFVAAWWLWPASRPGRIVDKSRGQLQQELQSPDKSVRADAATEIGRQRDVDGLADLIAALDDPELEVRARANAAIIAIFGGDLYFRADDPPDQRQQAIQRIKTHYEAWKKKGYPSRPSRPDYK